MPEDIMKQADIEALLSATFPSDSTAEALASMLLEQQEVKAKDLDSNHLDAIGELGNISMGAASTTLSLLLNQRVSITSPTISVTNMEELYKGFKIPHMAIYVRFIEGLTGFNLLIMQLKDAAVLASLMMGGDGTEISEDINEIGISAASEAMNQMIGAASTSMALMFGRTVNISPPETKIFREPGEITTPVHEGPVVVVWFDMTVGEILNTQIMQVMGMDTAIEEAELILGKFMQKVEPQAPASPAPGQPMPAGVVFEAGGEPVAAQQGQAAAPDDRPPAARKVAAPPGIDQKRLDLILDIPLKVAVLLGRTKWPIKAIMGLSPGSVVELQSIVDEPVEVLVNGTLVAVGEVVVVNENFGVRITSIIGTEQRIQNLAQ